MLAERFAALAESIELDVRLFKSGREIKSPGYRAQATRFKVDGARAVAEVKFVFSGPTSFDAVRWSEGPELLRETPVVYDGPAGSHRATLELEVGT